MPAFFHPNQHSAAAIAQMIFEDLQDPVQLVYENGDPLGDDNDDEEEEEEEQQLNQGPPPLEPQDEDDDMPDAAANNNPADELFPAVHQHHGNHQAAIMAHWFTAHHNHGPPAALQINDLDFAHIIGHQLQEVVEPVPLEEAGGVAGVGGVGAVEVNFHTIPQMHLFGVLPDDLMTLFHATSSQPSLQNGATMRMLKTRIMSIRNRKPQYWPRIAMGLYKRTARGVAGGCDARIFVKARTCNGQSRACNAGARTGNSDACTYNGGARTCNGCNGQAPTVVWAHKFILASNPVFRQLLGYKAVEDCLTDDGKLTDVDVPSISGDAMRTIVMATYDILPPKMTLELAQYLEYWAMRFCLDDLLQLCQKIMKTAPWR